MKLIVAMTGASGVIYGKRLLEMLHHERVETHLVISQAAERIIKHELNVDRKDLETLADYAYKNDDWYSPIVSGSFNTDGMVIAPCSMKTLAGIAWGYSENVILRAADVTIKENRTLILLPRETPLTRIHLRNMLNLAKQGVLIVPPMPAYYHNPKTIDGLVDYIVGKVLDLLGIDHALYKRWQSQ
jgi:4-hydroxy-3-polyprenylbenzoate decarboxylase